MSLSKTLKFSQHLEGHSVADPDLWPPCGGWAHQNGIYKLSHNIIVIWDLLAGMTSSASSTNRHSSTIKTKTGWYRSYPALGIDRLLSFLLLRVPTIFRIPNLSFATGHNVRISLDSSNSLTLPLHWYLQWLFTQKIQTWAFGSWQIWALINHSLIMPVTSLTFLGHVRQPW